MSVTIDVAESTVDPSTWESQDEAPYRCEVCGTSLTYGGRGRKPRFCDEHKRNGKPAGTRSSSGSMAALERQLGDLYRSLGMGVTMVDPESGFEIVGAADKLAHSWIVLAETNPKVKRFLVKLTTGSGVGAVIFAHGAVLLPILQRHDMLPNLFGSGKE